MKIVKIEIKLKFSEFRGQRPQMYEKNFQNKMKICCIGVCEADFEKKILQKLLKIPFRGSICSKKLRKNMLENSFQILCKNILAWGVRLTFLIFPYLGRSFGRGVGNPPRYANDLHIEHIICLGFFIRPDKS